MLNTIKSKVNEMKDEAMAIYMQAYIQKYLKGNGVLVPVLVTQGKINEPALYFSHDHAVAIDVANICREAKLRNIGLHKYMRWLCIDLKVLIHNTILRNLLNVM